MKIDIVVGGTWHAPQLASSLAALGADVRVISSIREGWNVGEYEVAHIPVKQVIRAISRLPSAGYLLAEAFGGIACHYLRENARTVAWASFGAPASRRVPTLLVRGSHHIATQRELLVAAGVPPRRCPSPMSVALERKEYRIASDVTVPTDAIARDQKWLEDCTIPLVSPYGFDCGEKSSGDCARSLDRIVTGGEMCLRKGADRLAAAFPTRSVAGVTECVVGAARGRSLPIPQWWDVRGRLSHAEWHELLASAAVFVLLSREEGMARAGLEALAEGTPVVVTRETGLAEFAEAGAGVVVGGDALETVEAVRQVRAAWADYHFAALEVSGSWKWVNHAQEIYTRLESY